MAPWGFDEFVALGLVILCCPQATLKNPIAGNFVLKQIWNEGSAEAVSPDEVEKITLKNLFKKHTAFASCLEKEPVLAAADGDAEKQVVVTPAAATKDPKKQKAEDTARMIIANRRGRQPPGR